jgi:hypothetical protein
MTDQDWMDLGQRAMACKGWRWLPGMLAHQPGLTWQWRRHSVAKWSDALGVRRDIPADAVPDLRDPATVGCLLALAREAWGDASGGPVPVTAADRGGTSGGPPVWFVVWSHGPCGDPFNRAEPTEAHALVAALEAAP